MRKIKAEINFDLPDFIATVRSMRQVQREFFTTKRPECLLTAKELEKIVDAMLEAMSHEE